MSDTAQNLPQYDGKKVTLKLSDEAEAFQATVEAATPLAVIFKRKGKSQVEFKDAALVESIELIDEAEPVVKARRQDFVSLDNIKRHLVDRHGYAVADVNAMKAIDALNFHDTIDHTPLGHFHADKPVKEDPTEAASE